MSYNYTQFVTSLANRMAIQSTAPAFQIELPNIIDAAEQRCYREVDLLDTRVSDATGTLTAASRTFNLPTSIGRFVVIETINVVTPVTATLSTGSRNQLVNVSLDTLDILWPTETNPTTPSVPTLFAFLSSQILRVGAAPDAPYPMEVVGTIRPNPISASNPTTLLSLYLPDLFLAAAMVTASGYQKNFGAQADDPKMAQSWETQYQIARTSATTEEFRKKYAGSDWSSKAAAPEAQLTRT
jgi:hypothetical protein